MTKVIRSIKNWLEGLLFDDIIKLSEQNKSKLDYAKQELEKLKRLYDLGGQDIPFEHFEQLELMTPTQIADGVMATLFNKTKNRLDMIIHYAENTFLGFHNHPNAHETVLHIKGNSDIYINNNPKLKAEEYKFVEIDSGNWRKFVNNSKAISVVKLERKQNYEKFN